MLQVALIQEKMVLREQKRRKIKQDLMYLHFTESQSNNSLTQWLGY